MKEDRILSENIAGLGDAIGSLSEEASGLFASLEELIPVAGDKGQEDNGLKGAIDRLIATLERGFPQGRIEKSRDNTIREVRADSREKSYSDQISQYQANSSLSIEQYTSISNTAGQVISSLVQRDGETVREIMRSNLRSMIGYVEKQVEMAMIASGARTLISGGVLGFGELAKMAALKAGFATLKASVASFDDGGIPVKDGLAMLHRTDVTLNPTTENPLMNTLVERLSEAGQSNGYQAIYMDGKKVGEIMIDRISRRNKTLPRGRDVFDESRWN